MITRIQKACFDNWMTRYRDNLKSGHFYFRILKHRIVIIQYMDTQLPEIQYPDLRNPDFECPDFEYAMISGLRKPGCHFTEKISKNIEVISLLLP